MKKKRLFAFVFTAVLCIALLTPSVWAGGRHAFPWEGIAIGVGAVILGNALIHHHHEHYRPAPPAHVHYPAHRSRYRRHKWARRVWVPPTYRKLWVPGHHDRWGEWVPGRWFKVLEEPGYWARKRFRPKRR